MKKTMRTALACVLFGSVAFGCASQPTLDTSGSAERTYDGLYPFENTIVDQAWARADLDLSGYSKIKLEGVGIQYRPTSASAGSRFAARWGRDTAFPIDEKQRERLREVVASAFLDELQKLESFELTNDTGPDVLILRGALLDVVSRVPPEPIGRVDIYLESVGEATLMLEMVDSQTNTVLVRAIDRRDAESRGMPLASSPVTNWTEVRRLAQSWARLLRMRLDEISAAMTLSEDAI